jgi:hypothetical protein
MWVVAIIFVAGLAMAGCIALVNDEDAYGRITPTVSLDSQESRFSGS